MSQSDEPSGSVNPSLSAIIPIRRHWRFASLCSRSRGTGCSKLLSLPRAFTVYIDASECVKICHCEAVGRDNPCVFLMLNPLVGVDCYVALLLTMTCDASSLLRHIKRKMLLALLATAVYGAVRTPLKTTPISFARHK